tara:strand:+ start:2901 stop:4352 length:1452 start_codon:yes stop_codon:yes gene_type:complete
MFAEGDIVVSRSLTPSQINPVEITTKIVEQDGNFFAIKQRSSGEIIDQEYVDVSLSPTGNPVEAYERQQGNRLASTIGKIGLGISALPFLQTKGFGSAVSGIGNLVGRLRGFTPVKVTKKPGVAVAGQKGFQALPKFDPRSYKYDVQTGPASVLGGTAIASTAFGAGTSAEDVAEEIAALQAEKQITTQKDKDEETAVTDASYEVVTTGQQDGQEKDKDDEAAEVVVDETPEQKQASIFQSKNFSDLIRNIGIKMVETGQIGAGIAEGSALTALEQKEAEQATGEISEFQEFLAKEEIKNINKFQDNQAKYAADLSESIFEVETSDGVLKAITEAKKLVETGDATGLTPLVREYFNETLRFFGQDIKLSTREAAKNYINDIINGNIKELTGESGRTISNLDRQIAGSLVGKIEWNSSKENVLDKLDKAYARAKSRYKLGMTNYEASLKPYVKYNATPPFDLGKSVSDTGQQDTQEERIRLTIK